MDKLQDEYLALVERYYQLCKNGGCPEMDAVATRISDILYEAERRLRAQYGHRDFWEHYQRFRYAHYAT
jgi:hypothetical protein